MKWALLVVALVSVSVSAQPTASARRVPNVMDPAQSLSGYLLVIVGDGAATKVEYLSEAICRQAREEARKQITNPRISVFCVPRQGM